MCNNNMERPTVRNKFSLLKKMGSFMRYTKRINIMTFTERIQTITYKKWLVGVIQNQNLIPLKINQINYH